MKKKGLIVATIVMVLVLAVSLTTATYAWFTANATATVENIAFSVDAGSDLLIGVAATNHYVSSPVANGFYSGADTTYVLSGNDAGTWTGTTQALGSRVDTNLDLSSMTKAIGTGTENNNVVTIDSAFTYGHTVYKANGSGTTPASATNIEAAVANGTGDGTQGTVKGDYLDVCFGVQAGNDTVESIALVIGAVADTSDTYVGMNAAIHVRYCVDQDDTVAANWTEVDLYNTSAAAVAGGLSTVSYLTKHTDMTGDVPTYAVDGITWAAGDAAIKINIAGTAGSNTNIDRTIHQVHIIVFVDGLDADCNNGAMGVGSTLHINFTNTTYVAP